MEERKELIELLAVDKNILAASKIANNWVHIRWHTEFDFWKEFESIIKLSSDYQIRDIQKFTINSINSVLHQRKNRNPWYGLLFTICRKGDVDFCIFIERGLGNLYFGLLMLNAQGERIENDDLNFNKISKAIEKDCEWNNVSWLGAVSLEPKVNMELFNEEATLMLVNQEYRKIFIQDNWRDIEKFINICLKEINEIYCLPNHNKLDNFTIKNI